MWAMILFVVHAHRPEGVILVYIANLLHRVRLELILVIQKDRNNVMAQAETTIIYIYISMKKNLNTRY